MQMITEDATNDVDPQGYSVSDSNKFKVKTECWNEETNSVVPECMYEDGSIKPECYKEQVSEVQPVAIKEFQTTRYMSVEEFINRYERSIDGITNMYMSDSDIDEDEARYKAIQELAADKGIEISDL